MTQQDITPEQMAELLPFAQEYAQHQADVKAQHEAEIQTAEQRPNYTLGIENMRITEVTWCEVTLVDGQGYISHVFQQSDKKWKCLRCQRYRCAHARFVIVQNPTLPPAPSSAVDEIFTY